VKAKGGIAKKNKNPAGPIVPERRMGGIKKSIIRIL